MVGHLVHKRIYGVDRLFVGWIIGSYIYLVSRERNQDG